VVAQLESRGPGLSALRLKGDSRPGEIGDRAPEPGRAHRLIQYLLLAYLTSDMTRQEEVA
jgi:hypothetical protein